MASSLYKIPAVSAVVRGRTSKGWRYLDVSNSRCVDLFGNYTHIEVPIVDAFNKQFTLNLYDYEYYLRDNVDTIAVWLSRWGNKTLTLKEGYPELATATANYIPVPYKKVDIALAKRSYHPSHVVPMEDYDDLIVKYDNITPKYLCDHTLCSVNGYYVRSTFHSYGMRIYNAGDIIRKSGKLSLGMLNFEKIGHVKKIPISPSMVFKVDENLTYYDRLIIKVGVPLYNKSVGIVIGGYLHLLDGLVKVVGDDTIMISLKSMKYIARVLESRNSLDLSFMQMDNIETGNIVAKMVSDDIIIKYLTSVYSFIVTVNNPNMWKETVGVDRAAMLNKYVTDRKLLGPIFTQRGKSLDYWPKYEAGLWGLSTDESEMPRYLFSTHKWQTNFMVNDALIGKSPYEPVIPTMHYYNARIGIPVDSDEGDIVDTTMPEDVMPWPDLAPSIFTLHPMQYLAGAMVAEQNFAGMGNT